VGCGCVELNKDVYLVGGLPGQEEDLVRLSLQHVLGRVRGHHPCFRQRLACSWAFLRRLAEMIRCPLQAFGLVCEAAELLRCRALGIRLLPGTQGGRLARQLVFQLRGRNTNPAEFYSLLHMTDLPNPSPRDQQTALLGHLLRTGCLRLGRTVLLVDRSDNLVKVALISVDSALNPCLD
jgi:hypothetical protein